MTSRKKKKGDNNFKLLLVNILINKQIYPHRPPGNESLLERTVGNFAWTLKVQYFFKKEKRKTVIIRVQFDLCLGTRTFFFFSSLFSIDLGLTLL
jgi:hypothetical protein